MQKLPHTRNCFVCGSSNPLGLKLEFETDGKIVTARFIPKEQHIGFSRTLHGGIISTVLDEAMVWACGVQTKRFAFCAELVVRFLKSARPGEELVLEGELVENKRNKIYMAKGALRSANGELLAASTGKYIPIDPVLTQEMILDFEPPVELDWLKPPLPAI